MSAKDRLTPAATGVGDRDGRPHALLELAAERVDQGLALLVQAWVALADEGLAVPRHHA